MGQKRAGFVFVERTESSLLGAGEDTGLRGIITNIPVALCLSQSAVKNAVNAFKLTELGGHMLQPKIRRGGR